MVRPGSRHSSVAYGLLLELLLVLLGLLNAVECETPMVACWSLWVLIDEVAHVVDVLDVFWLDTVEALQKVPLQVGDFFLQIRIGLLS